MIQAAGAQLVGVSTDHIYALDIFQRSLGGLPFPLASDWMRQIAVQYGVYDETRGIARRSVFLLTPQEGRVFENRTFQAGNPEHYQAVLDRLQELAPPNTR